MAAAYENLMQGRLPEVMGPWRALGREPQSPTELGMVAESLADMGDEAAVVYIEQLRAVQPAEADAIMGRLRFRQNRHIEVRPGDRARRSAPTGPTPGRGP